MKRLHSTKMWPLISAFVILLTAAIILVSGGSDKGVSVTFQHFFKHPVNGRMALFVITNQCDRRLTFVAGPPCQVKINGVWKELEQGGGSIWAQAVGDTWEFNGTLEPGAWSTVGIIVPEGIRDWRAAVRSAGTLKSLPGVKGIVYSDWPMTNYSREFTSEFDAMEPSSSPKIPEP